MMLLKKNAIVLFPFLLIMALCLTGCGTQPDSEGEASVAEAELSDELAGSDEYRLWEVVLGDYRDSVFRGVSFDDTREKVKITESFELFEELPDQIGYTHDTKQLETVDVYYRFSEDQLVDTILVDVFLNGKPSADRLWEISGWYFTNQYGAASEAGETRRIWLSKGLRVMVENVSTGIDNGLKITFSPSERDVLARRSNGRGLSVNEKI